MASRGEHHHGQARAGQDQTQGERRSVRGSHSLASFSCSLTTLRLQSLLPLDPFPEEAAAPLRCTALLSTSPSMLRRPTMVIPPVLAKVSNVRLSMSLWSVSATSF